MSKEGEGKDPPIILFKSELAPQPGESRNAQFVRISKDIELVKKQLTHRQLDLARWERQVKAAEEAIEIVEGMPDEHSQKNKLLEGAHFTLERIKQEEDHYKLELKRVEDFLLRNTRIATELAVQIAAGEPTHQVLVPAESEQETPETSSLPSEEEIRGDLPPPPGPEPVIHALNETAPLPGETRKEHLARVTASIETLNDYLQKGEAALRAYQLALVRWEVEKKRIDDLPDDDFDKAGRATIATRHIMGLLEDIARYELEIAAERSTIVRRERIKAQLEKAIEEEKDQ